MWMEEYPEGIQGVVKGLTRGSHEIKLLWRQATIMTHWVSKRWSRSSWNE